MLRTSIIDQTMSFAVDSDGVPLRCMCVRLCGRGPLTFRYSTTSPVESGKGTAAHGVILRVTSGWFSVKKLEFVDVCCCMSIGCVV